MHFISIVDCEVQFLILFIKGLSAGAIFVASLILELYGLFVRSF